MVIDHISVSLGSYFASYFLFCPLPSSLLTYNIHIDASTLTSHSLDLPDSGKLSFASLNFLPLLISRPHHLSDYSVPETVNPKIPFLFCFSLISASCPFTFLIKLWLSCDLHSLESCLFSWSLSSLLTSSPFPPGLDLTIRKSFPPSVPSIPLLPCSSTALGYGYAPWEQQPHSNHWERTSIF